MEINALICCFTTLLLRVIPLQIYMTYLNALFATSTLLIFSSQCLPLYPSSSTSCPWLLHASSPVLLVLTSLSWSHILLHYRICSSSARPFLVIWLLLHLFILVSPQDLWSSSVLSQLLPLLPSYFHSILPTGTGLTCKNLQANLLADDTSFWLDHLPAPLVTACAQLSNCV